jgi:hypothetical protein
VLVDPALQLVELVRPVVEPVAEGVDLAVEPGAEGVDLAVEPDAEGIDLGVQPVWPRDIAGGLTWSGSCQSSELY